MTLLLLFQGPSGPAAPAEPGGGGFGAVMRDAFFQRYESSFREPRFETRYKPTIRKQK